MALPILLEDAIDPAPLAGKSIAIIGFGNQGRAHALNLRDGGFAVQVGARSEGNAHVEAAKLGFHVRSISEASAQADVVMILLPDERHSEVYERDIRPHLRPGQALAFGHGFSIRFGLVVPPPTVDVVLVAPVGPGRLLRSQFEANRGIPCLAAVHQDASGGARGLALAYARALGGGRAGVIETTFAEETETDLFGEQAVVCGGVTSLILAGFETLVEAGYPEELAYFECCHQMKLLTDLIHERGVAGMRGAISNTAKYGDLTRGPRVVDASVKARMKEILGEIRDGRFAKEWVAEDRAQTPRLRALLDESEKHAIEPVGRRLRGLGKK